MKKPKINKPPMPDHIKIPHCGINRKPTTEEGSGASPCSSWVVAKVISEPFTTQQEAESFAQTMMEGFNHRNDILIVTKNANCDAAKGRHP